MKKMRMVRWLLVLCFAFAWTAGSAIAQQLATRQVEVSAVGANEMDALMQAIISAVNQINGTRVGGVTLAVVKESVKDNKVTSSADLARFAATVSQGAVKNYEVLESGKELIAPGQTISAAQQWRVRIRANVVTYDGGVQLKRLRLAVVPMQFARELKANAAAKQFAADFTDKLESLLTQSRRFAMLDRKFSDTVDKELTQYATASFSPEETARIGKKAGTDYLLVSELSKYEVIDESIHLGMTDRTIPRKTARALIQLRLIDVATSQIKYAKNIDTGDNTARTIGAAQGMLGGIVEKASSEIISSVYPIAIVAADATSVTLGQGGDSIKAGQRFQVLSLGEAMKDPYTGETLGRRESLIGMVEVTAVTDRVSTAKIVDGAPAIVAKGGKDMIVRSTLTGASPAAPPSVQNSDKGAPVKTAAKKLKKEAEKAGGKKDDEDW